MLAREYRVAAVAIAGVALLVQFGVGTLPAIPLWLLAAAVAWLFREPSRAHYSRPLGIVSAIDGHVVSVGPVHDAYLDRDAHEIVVQAGLLDPFTLRGPIEGQIVELWARLRDSERPGIALLLRTDEDDAVVLVVEPRLPWALRRRLRQGERLGHGRVYGTMPFGGRVRILIGEHARTVIEPGTPVRGGLSVVAELLHD